MIAAKHPSTNKGAGRVTNYTQYEGEIDDSGITWPIPLTQIPRFERQNKYVVIYSLLDCDNSHITKLNDN